MAPVPIAERAGNPPTEALSQHVLPCLPCAAGNAGLVRLLLSLGADTSIRDEQGCTPIHQATLEEARLPALIALLESDAVEVDARAIGEWTPLHFAASCGNVAAVEVLLRHGADVHARTAAGATAFMLCARGGSFVLSSKLSVTPVPCCKLLLQVGAGGQGWVGMGWGGVGWIGVGW